MHHERIEVAGVGERPAHHLGVGDRDRSVAEGDGARRLQQPDLGEFGAAPATRQRRHRQQPHAANVAGAAKQEVDHGGDRRWRARIRTSPRSSSRRRRRPPPRPRRWSRGARSRARPRRRAYRSVRARPQGRGSRSAPHRPAILRAPTAGPTAAIRPSRISTPPDSSRPASGSTRRARIRARGGRGLMRHLPAGAATGPAAPPSAPPRPSPPARGSATAPRRPPACRSRRPGSSARGA